DERLKLVESPATLYYHLSINLVGPSVAPALAKDGRVREALDAAIDRALLNQVVFNGKYVPNNQPILPGSTYYDADIPVPSRDLANANRLLRESGVEHPAFALLVANSPIDQQVAQVIQSMVVEAVSEM